MFFRFRRDREGPTPGKDPIEGERLFELGMAHAARFRTSEAIDCYTRSIAANPNAAPYMNRANPLRRRMRYEEARDDLMAARKLDRAGANEFSAQLEAELEALTIITATVADKMRGPLRQDLAIRGPEYVAGRLLCVSFDIAPEEWETHRSLPAVLRLHLFNEFDNILKFEDAADYADIRSIIALHPVGRIAQELDETGYSVSYIAAEMKLHAFLACYEMADRQLLRSAMLRALHARFTRPDARTQAQAVQPDTVVDFLDSLMPKPAQPQKLRIGGIEMPRSNITDADRQSFAWQAVAVILARAPGDYEIYRYLMEECERFANGRLAHFILNSRHNFMPLEYEGSAESAPQNEKWRAALHYLDDEVTPELTRLMGERNAEELRMLIFMLFCDAHRDAMIALRLKHAVHYHNNCMSNGHYTYVDRWGEVIDWLERA